jgi:hypothetical protein
MNSSLILLICALLLSSTLLVTGHRVAISPVASSNADREKGDAPCDVCELIVKFVQPFLSDNATDAKIEAEAEKLCTIIPTKYQGMCKAFVDAYLPQIIQLAATESPQQVCATLKLCSSSQLGPERINQAEIALLNTLLAPQKVTGPSTSCTICEYIATLVLTYLKQNASIAYITQKAEEACTLVPKDYQALCKAMADQYVPVYIQMAATTPPAVFCAYVGACSSQRETTFVEDKHRCLEKDKAMCSPCVMAVTLADQYLASNAGLNKTQTLLQSLCDKMQGDLAAKCSAAVTMFGESLVEALANLPPSKVCSTLGLCDKQEEAILYAEISTAGPGELCKVCEMVDAFLDGWLKNNQSIVQIETELGKVCNVLPKKDAALCNAILDQYMPLIINWLIQQSPQNLCTAIHVCSSSTSPIDAGETITLTLA